MAVAHHKMERELAKFAKNHGQVPLGFGCGPAAKTQYNLKNAKEYFEEHLCVGDYYTEGQQVTGEWFGLGGERLGLSGKVLADEFHPAL